ncbi:Ferric/cupric reductase transmembrane component 7 [Candida viswanathii]|uniref:ferric-chelate reductase (NADPH) n=1 Tax=Candida viswanathii TaxID=5486 RepID=A0A367YI95_9ASCO|nr:Ferric/cupric reductase transmembrane component 7 [Candida viswanathii]
MFSKRSVTYNGLDCLADADTDEYRMYHQELQAAISWASQANYAKYTVYFGVATIFAATLKHLYYRYRDIRYRSKQSSNVGTALVDVLTSYCRYFGYMQVPKWLVFFSVPNSVGSALYMFLSSLYLLCYCLVPHFWYRGCGGFGSPPLGVRAGMMATALTPFIYVLAGKSNAITLLTGISYEKLNTFHQYVGVAAFVLGVIHTVPFVHQALAEGGSSRLNEKFTTDFGYYSGIPPLILLGLLCILSKACIRKYVYELFLHAHWMMGIAYFGTLIWHIDSSLDADDYMWGALAFWAAQIVYRILIKTAFKPNAMFLRPREASLEKLGDGVYQVLVANTKGVKWEPGQHCFLRFVGFRILDSHPFSIASMDQDGATGMKFIIKAQKGLTKSLYKQLDKQIITNKKVYIDGPYGGTFRDPRAFEKVVLVSSGTGVTATLPFLTYLMGEAGALVKKITFIWVVRQLEDVSWIRSELLECQRLGGSKVDIQIHVTGNPQPAVEKQPDPEKELGTESSSADESELPISYGRPSVSGILMSMIGRFSSRNMIVCSGSDSMKREVSSTVSELQALVFNNDKYTTNVEEIYLHTESFAW